MRNWMKMIPAALGLTLALSFPAGADDKFTEYMSEYYHTAPFEDGEDLDINSVNGTLEALGVEATADDTEEEIIKGGIRAAGLEELALTYVNDDVPDKAARFFEKAGLTEEVAQYDYDDEYLPYIACAIDMGLLDIDEEGSAEELINHFLYRCAEAGGKARHYIGRVQDDDILEAVGSVLGSFTMFDNQELTDLGTTIVLEGAATGYNLKYEGYDAHFLADYTLKYGHSDYQHAVQLIGLLKSEGMDAYIQIEPKVSVYEYLLDWGDPGEPTPTYMVKQVTDDRYLCYAVEYDMMIEFDTKEDKEAFHGLIETYAKKYDDSFDADGNLVEKLLAGSWWQPLYSSTTEMENEEFGEMVDNIVYDKDGLYSIHPFSLPENCEKIAEVVAENAPDLEVSPVTIWVNPAFMRYTTGEDYQ